MRILTNEDQPLQDICFDRDENPHRPRYRVIAANKAGDGPVSNTVAAVV